MWSPACSVVKRKYSLVIGRVGITGFWISGASHCGYRCTLRSSARAPLYINSTRVLIQLKVTGLLQCHHILNNDTSLMYDPMRLLDIVTIRLGT